MIIVFGIDRLRLRLAQLEAEITQLKLTLEIFDPVPRVFTDRLIKRQGQAARIRAALSLKSAPAKETP